MTDQTQPVETPVAQQPPIEPPVEVAAPLTEKRGIPKLYLIFGGVVLLLLLLLAVLFVFRRGGNSDATISPTPTPEIFPTSTPIRHMSAIATESAFLDLETTVKNLQSSLQGTVVIDTNLQPPVIELPLGFSN